MLGSADEAQKMLRNVSKFAANTPFELPELIDTTKRLLAYNIAAEDIIPTLTSLGNITAGIGREKMPQLILAYGQVRATTRLTGAELRQFSEAGVPLIGQLAQQFGVAESRILEMVSAGEIGFPAVEQAFQAMSGEGGKFFNLMERQSKTYDGVVSNLRDNFGMMGREIIGISQDGTIREGSIFQTLSNRAQQLLRWVDQNKAAIQQYVSVLLDRLVAVIQTQVIPWLERVGRELGAYLASDQFKHDLRDLASLMRGIGSALSWVWRTGVAVANTLDRIASFTPAGIMKNLGGLSGILSKLPGFANGTDFAPGGLAIVGERGPELVNLPRGSQVIPNHKMGGAGGVTIQSLTVNNYNPTDQQAMLADIGWAISRKIA